MDFPEICKNIVKGQLTHGSLLHYLPGTIFQDYQRYQALKPYKKKPKPSGYSWDEYPFASTFEGGEGASVMAVPISEQGKQAIKNRTFYQQNNLSVFSPFYVQVTK